MWRLLKALKGGRMPWGVLGGFNRLSNILAGLEVVKLRGVNLARRLKEA